MFLLPRLSAGKLAVRSVSSCVSNFVEPEGKRSTKRWCALKSTLHFHCWLHPLRVFAPRLGVNFLHSEEGDAMADGSEALPSYTMEEVAKHDQEDDLWMVIRGKVYNVTEYLDEHPGGDVMLVGCL